MKSPSDGIGSGSFVSYLSNLSPGTTYYVRAYAVNSEGTGFGPTLSFTTSLEQNSVSWLKKTDFPGGCTYTVWLVFLLVLKYILE